MDKSLKNFIEGIPKAELHLHIEGTFEPELMFKIAKRNGIKIKYSSVEELRKAYNFSNLQEFLDIYYEGAKVLLKEEDFFDLTFAYLKKIKEQNVFHTEIFFDPQTHTGRGVSFDTVIKGINRALEKGEKELGISSKLILCFLRHLDEESAFATLKEAFPFREWICGVGLDSSEVGNPPSRFERVFEMAKNEGFLCVAHAGEEGPSEYIEQALELLKADRIDHGNRSIESSLLIDKLAELKMPLTLCPLSNLELKVVEDLKDHPLVYMMEKGLMVTINSDDPAYFGGYINENFIAVAKALNLNKEQIGKLAKNSFSASWLSMEEKDFYIKKIDWYIAGSK